MPTYYRYKRPITNTGTVTSETMTVAEWKALEINEAILAFEANDGDIHDYSEFVSELQITHNDIDGEKAGRNKNTGHMVRAYITNKHTLNVKMVNHMPQEVVHKIFALIESTKDKQHFNVWFQRPCANEVNSCDVYCSTINYGAQRYDRKTNKCYYDGMNFNLIQM